MKKVILLLILSLLSFAAPAQQAKKGQRKTTSAQQSAGRRQQSGQAQKGKQQQKSKQQQQKGKQQKAQSKGGQQQPTVKGLQNERKELQTKRAANQRKQEELKRGVKRGMENLMILDQEIAQNKRVVDTIRNDINRLTDYITLLDRQLTVLQEELEDRRMRYMKSMRYIRRNRSVQDQLMFVFSADNFNQMYRRLRFSREYAAYQRAQGEAVKSKQKQVEEKKHELAESRNEKNTLLARGETEQKKLEGKQNEQQAQVNQLKKQQKTVEALILEQQRREEELNARIDKLIAEEIARERARQEAEAKKKAAAEAARKRAEELARKKAAAEAARKENERRIAEAKKAEEVYQEPAEDRRLSGSFEQNRGRLPLPITGAYRLVRGFGTYTPEGLSHVRLQSNGWHLKGQAGAQAQCIFDGEVSGVYMQNGTYIVTVRHGKYISAYINLASVNVRKGQRVKTRQALGTLGADHLMQFQLRNWNTLLNPSSWIGRR